MRSTRLKCDIENRPFNKEQAVRKSSAIREHTLYFPAPLVRYIQIRLYILFRSDLVSRPVKSYIDVYCNIFRGVWNVPFVSSTYLVHHSVLRQVKNPYSSKTFEADMAFCASIRSKVDTK